VNNLEISGNRIIDNGVSPKTEANGLQIGIYGFVTRYKTTDTLRVRDSEVRMPAGQALKIEGIGPMSRRHRP
jgi:hypothetical protein